MAPLNKTSSDLVKASGLEEARSREKTAELSGLRVPSLGRLPEVIILGSFGLLLIALAFSNSFTQTTWRTWSYWLGLLLIILPVAFRLFSMSVSRQERIGLIVFLGLSLYLVKVMHSPFMFTYSDELLHFRNASNIEQTKMLFGSNTILPVSAYYPGLETVTTAIATLSGLSIFTSGLLVIGVARLVIILSLYLLFEQVSSSSRVAGLAVLLYAANSNFLYWSAQFSYESLSLPLGILVLFILVKQIRIKDRKLKNGLSIIILILITAIIITHHVTSYALVTFLFMLSIIYSYRQAFSKRKQPNTWVITITAGVLTMGWLFWVATPTQRYLYQIFKQAYNSIFLLFTSGASGRVLFTSSTGVVAPLWERVVGITSVLLIMISIPAGLFALWKRQRLNPFAILLAGAASLYYVTLGLRFSGGSWELANRTSEFLFVGIGFLIAFGLATLRLMYPKNRSLSFVFAGYTAILIIGGVIAGWPPTLRLSQPLLVSEQGTILRSQGLEASEWMVAQHGSGNRIIAPTSDALLMLAYGRQQALTGNNFSIQELLTIQHTLDWQTSLLKKSQAHYLVMDRRQVSWDSMLGSYFSSIAARPGIGKAFYPPAIFTMFDNQAHIARIFDSGDIVIYDVGGLSGVTQTK